MLSEAFEKEILIFGCGNVLFGDDGFGPEVVRRLEESAGLPPHVLAEDVGTSIRDILFDLLLWPKKPKKILIIDAASRLEGPPGGLTELDPSRLEAEKTNDFSVHHFPSLNLLAELGGLPGVAVKILAAKTAGLPDEVRPGLSPEVEAAVPRACQWIIKEIGNGPCITSG